MHAPSRGLSAASHELVVLTSQHVACPWLFPKYFYEKWDWLQHVSEEFVQHSLQLLEPTSASQEPRVLVDLPLEPRVWLHEQRDLAMLSLDEIDWQAFSKQWDLQTLSLDPSPASAGDALLFSGHKQLPEAANSVGQYPKHVPGHFVGQTAQGQAFAWSEEVLEEGMCGGAVINSQSGDCVGLVEGIVPPFTAEPPTVVSSDWPPEQQQTASAEAASRQMREALADHVAFIPAMEIDVFLSEPGPQLLTGTALGGAQEDEDTGLW